VIGGASEVPPWVTTGKAEAGQNFSALALVADMSKSWRHFSVGPEADVAKCYTQAVVTPGKRATPADFPRGKTPSGDERL